MKLADLSDLDLIDLIKKASAELFERMNRPEIERVPQPRKLLVVREPSEEQKDFVLMIKAKVQRGDYIRADTRRRVAEITSEYPEWARLQRMPTEHNTGAWREAGQFHTIVRAKER